MTGHDLHPNLNHAELWWLHCSLCGLACYAGAVPRFSSEAELWRAMLAHGWTRNDDGRVFCPGHSSVGCCQRRGHLDSGWSPHPIEV